MIKFHFKELIDKENLSINQVSKDTGINRASLTSIANNSISMVRLETLDILCNYFSINLNELITFAPDDYIVNVPVQPKESRIIYAYAVKKSAFLLAKKENRFYNADENEITFCIYYLVHSTEFGIITVGYPFGNSLPAFKKKTHFNEKKLKKWAESLSEKQKIDICQQSISIFINQYWKKLSSPEIGVVFNTNNNLTSSLYSFKITKNKDNSFDISYK